VKPGQEKQGGDKVFRRRVKLMIDLLLSGIGLLVLLIPFGVIATAVKLDSKGPVFFRQEGTRGCLEHGDLLS